MRGQKIVDALLAPIGGQLHSRGRPISLKMRARKITDGDKAVAITVPDHFDRGFCGEFQQTIAVPISPSQPEHTFAIERLSQLLGRHHSIELMSRRCQLAHHDCSYDFGYCATSVSDLPALITRINCPLPLRCAMDAAGLDDDERLRVVETRDAFKIGNITIRVKDVFQMASRSQSHVSAMIWSTSRATIEAPGVKWSQSINHHYLDIDQILPSTVISCIVGMPVRRLTNLPGLSNAPGIVVLSHQRYKGRTRLVLSRAFAYAAGDIPMIGHGIMEC